MIVLFSSDDLYYHKYFTTQFEMDPYFKQIIQDGTTRILIYNGDVDETCNFLLSEFYFHEKIVTANNMEVNYCCIILISWRIC